MKHLLIDGSNLVHAWPELRSLAKQDRVAARERLVQQVASLHDGGAMRVTVVFDGRGEALQVEQVGGVATFTKIMTPDGMTADDVIEQMVGKSASPGECEVVTGDQAERSTVEALGARWVRPEELAARLEAGERRLAAQLTRLREGNRREWGR